MTTRTLPNRATLECEHRWGIVHDHDSTTMASVASCSGAEPADMFDHTFRCDGQPGTRIGICALCKQAKMFPAGRLTTWAEREVPV